MLLPLTLKQVTSMQRLQVLAPEMRAIQAKYRDDKQRQQQEMMKFYRENRVNPLASCLPLLFQLPFFIALYYMLRSDLKVDMCPGIEGYATSIDKSVSNVTCTQFGDSAYAAAHHITVADPSFLFIPDLTAKATGAVLIVLIVLYVASQLASRPAQLVLDGQKPAHDHAGPADRLRDVHHQFPGGSARVLDHDERLDDRAAADRAKDGRGAETPCRRRLLVRPRGRLR